MPPRRQKGSATKLEIPDVKGMMAQTFRLHCQIRHPALGFWSRGEHDSDHRLHAETIDHIHTPREEATEDAISATAESGEPSPSSD